MKKTRPGDKGQRFEALCLDSANQLRVWGWAENDFGCQCLLKAIELNPSMHGGFVVDRHAPVTKNERYSSYARKSETRI